MELKYLSKWVFAALILLTASCKEEEPVEIVPSSGSANFSRYIAIGNSLTAGFADGGLYLSGQINSFPNILAGQMKLTIG